MLWSDFERFQRLWDPWLEFERRGRSLSRASIPTGVDYPAVNVWISNDSAVLTTEVPGIESSGIDVSVVGTTLTLRGSRHPEELKEGEAYHRRERWSGQFTKTVELPFAIETDKVNARFSKGVLTVTLPRAEAERPRKIAVKSE